MRNFTKKQKRMLRRMSAVLSSCIIMALTLAAVVVANTRPAVPVRFSDIQEGASVTASHDDPKPEGAAEQSYLYETMYPVELAALTPDGVYETDPYYIEPSGAGGTLLLDTTATTPIPNIEIIIDPPETTASTTTTAAVTTRPSPAVTTAPRTTAAAARTTTTAAHTSKKPFTNIGGGKVSTDDSVFIRMLSLVNNARRSKGLKDLWYSARVHDVASLRVYELSSYYSHTRPNGTAFNTAFTETGTWYRMAGENIAYGRNMFETPEEVFKAWMDSDSHRENILNPDYECVAFGLCTLKVGSDTYYYWAQEFAKF